MEAVTLGGLLFGACLGIGLAKHLLTASTGDSHEPTRSR